jgi:hypothetical protein
MSVDSWTWLMIAFQWDRPIPSFSADPQVRHQLTALWHWKNILVTGKICLFN